MVPYVREVFDPQADGNCGFRCIAKALGYDDDGWFQVRREMLEYAQSHRSNYERMLGGSRGFEKLVTSLSVKKLSDKAPRAKWLDNFKHAQLVAETYRRPLCLLDPKLIGCSSWVPQQSGPPGNSTEPIYLSFVNGCHWQLVYVQGDPVPIPRPLITKSAVKPAHGWPKVLSARVNLWKKICLD